MDEEDSLIKLISYDVGKCTNESSLEVAWACKAAERASIHMGLLMSCKPSILSLHKLDSQIYTKFREFFPELSVEKVTENELKGDRKNNWREFCEIFKTDVEEYNLGTIMRMRANGAYSEENTIIVPKIIYLAVEVARNKEGLNDKYQEAIKNEHDKVQLSGGNIC